MRTVAFVLLVLAAYLTFVHLVSLFFQGARVEDPPRPLSDLEILWQVRAREGDAVVSAMRRPQRVAMALAEGGYPDALLELVNGAFQWTNSPRTPHAFAAFWQATSLATTDPIPCWACWNASGRRVSAQAQDCAKGNCAHPEGPTRPPRELLRSAS